MNFFLGGGSIFRYSSVDFGAGFGGGEGTCFLQTSTPLVVVKEV